MTAGRKDDKGKIRVDLLPTEALVEVAKVLTFGASKYDPWNWKAGMAYSRLYGATLRHLFAWSEREDHDPESGLLHLAHAGCNILFLLAYQVLNIGTDDRYKGEK